MKRWALPDAKARLPERVCSAEREPQPRSITLRGEEAAVLVFASEYRQLQGKGKAAKRSMTLLEALRTCPCELEIPPPPKTANAISACELSSRHLRAFPKARKPIQKLASCAGSARPQKI